MLIKYEECGTSERIYKMVTGSSYSDLFDHLSYTGMCPHSFPLHEALLLPHAFVLEEHEAHNELNQKSVLIAMFISLMPSFKSK